VIKRVAFVAILAYGILHGVSEPSAPQGSSTLAPQPPRQSDASGLAPFRFKEYRITPLAHIELRARVLGSEIYRDDREAKLAPFDLAVGWGPMSDDAVLSRLTLSQRERFLHWSADPLPIPRSTLVSSASNLHIIPADRHIANRLADVRKDQVVEIEGYLIRADAPDGWHWISSLTRDDSGPGACELVWVEKLQIIEPNG
jgi:hypothetical protein